MTKLAAGLYSFFLPIAQVGFLVSVFILLPLAYFRSTRRFAGLGLIIASYLFGLVTWLLGMAVTFASFGWVGLILGLLILGIGVVPMGIYAAFFRLHLTDLGWSLVIMVIVSVAARFGGAYALTKAEGGSLRFT